MSRISKPLLAMDHHVAGRICTRRVVLHMTRERLADLIGVTPQQAHKYERAKNRITASRLYRIAEALEVGIEYFFDEFEEDIPLPPQPRHVALLAELVVDLAQIPGEKLVEHVRGIVREIHRQEKALA